MAEMKAVILGMSPELRIVDISHEIEKFNVAMGSYTFVTVSPYFPKGTIQGVVIDPALELHVEPYSLRQKTAIT